MHYGSIKYYQQKNMILVLDDKAVRDRANNLKAFSPGLSWLTPPFSNDL